MGRENMQAPHRPSPFSAKYTVGPGPTPVHISVFRNLSGQLRLEFAGEPRPPYMKIMICDKSTKRNIELDPETHTFWKLGDDVIEPPWLSTPTKRMVMTGETKIILGTQCKLYVSNRTDDAQLSEVWFADELGIAVNESQMLDGVKQITLQMTNLQIGEPDPKLFVIPQGYHENTEPRDWEE